LAQNPLQVVPEKCEHRSRWMAPLSEEQDGPALQLSGATREQVLCQLEHREAPCLQRLDLSALNCVLDGGLSESLLSFCGVCPAGVQLRLAHNDLGSGTDCEQRIFDLKAEREMRESEKAYHQKKKSDSSKEKDFAASAQMRRKAEEGINVTAARLASIDEELEGLERRKAEVPWCQLFSRVEAQSLNTIRCLDLANCGLHATGLVMLTNVMMELENRADGASVSHLVLDGNDLGDIGMGSIATLLRLSKALEVLQVRNVGITDQGVSQVLSGLVSNKSLALLDLRANGLCSPEVGKAAVAGMRRFNRGVEVLMG